MAAVLNSEPFSTVVAGYIVDNSVSTHPINNLIIPKYSSTNSLHEKLASLSKKAHAAAEKGDDKSIRDVEAAINKASLKLW